MKKILLTILALVFSLSVLTACDKSNNDDNNQPTVIEGLDNATLTSLEKEYTGEALAIAVENLPSGTFVTYSYKCNDTEVKEMIEVGTYDVTATIKSKDTEEVLKTLTAKLTIKDIVKYDEIPADAEESLELMFGTTIIKMMPNPDQNGELIAGGVELWASESIYFRLASYDEPLNFLELNSDSVECSKVVKNTIFVSQPGTYDFIMKFPEGAIVPQIFVRQGSDNSEIYFRTSKDNFEMDRESGTNLFTVDEETNTATYEASLVSGDVFKITNYYSSLAFGFEDYFSGRPIFAAASSNNDYNFDCIKVASAGNYKFVIDLTTKGLKIFKDNEEVQIDHDMLYFRSSINNFGTTLPLVKDGDMSYIEVNLEPGHTFKIADRDWKVQYNAGGYTADNKYDKSLISMGEEQNYSVVVEGLYRFEITLDGTMTIYKNGQKIGAAKNTNSMYNVYQVVVRNGQNEQRYTMTCDGPWDMNPSFTQYRYLGIALKAGDVVSFYDVTADVAFTIPKVDPTSVKDGEKDIFVIEGSGIKVNKDGTYNMYVKLKMNEDNIYFGAA